MMYRVRWYWYCPYETNYEDFDDKDDAYQNFIECVQNRDIYGFDCVDLLREAKNESGNCWEIINSWNAMDMCIGE